MTFTVLEGALVRVEDLRRCSSVEFRRLVAREIRANKKSAVVPLLEILQNPLSCHSRPSRSISMPTPTLAALIWELLWCIQQHIEATAAHPMWTMTNCLTLTPEFGNKKCRQMSEAYKRAVLDTKKSSPDKLSSREILGTHKASASAEGSMARTPSSDSLARRTDMSHTLRFMAAGRIAFKSPPTLHWTHDAVQAGGDHNDVFIGWLPGKNLMAPAPLQVSAKTLVR